MSYYNTSLQIDQFICYKTGHLYLLPTGRQIAGAGAAPAKRTPVCVPREAVAPEVSLSPEKFAAFVRKDHAVHESIVKASGAKVK